MDGKISHIITCLGMLLFLTVFGVWLLFKMPDVYSASERRVLATKVKMTAETLLNGSFMTDYEAYALDQFPLRDAFRSVKAVNEHYVLQKMDSNKLFVQDGHLSKLEYPMKESMIDNAAKKFNFLYEKYMKEKGIQPYLVIVPDKNYFLSQNSSVLALDYDVFYDTVRSKLDYMQYIEIRDLLELDDYYKTDTHWRQECITDVAERILRSMKVDDADWGLPGDKKTLELPFEGVYKGQTALPAQPDRITYLDSDILRSCTVLNYDTGKPVKAQVYDEAAAAGRDGYDFFLEGPTALITVENPMATTERELVIFRDSFGSSLAPLLTAPYKKVTLVDIRYMQSGMVGAFLDFENQDVLFEYSTVLLNNSLGMK